MNRNRLSQLFLFLTLLFIGQWFANSWPVSWREVVTSNDGRIFTVSSYPSFRGAELWEWQPDLSSKRPLRSFWHSYGQVLLSEDASVMICDTGSKVLAINTANGETLWMNEDPLWRRIHLLDGGRHGLYASGNDRQIDTISVFDIRTGDIKEELSILDLIGGRGLKRLQLCDSGFILKLPQAPNEKFAWDGTKMVLAAEPPTASELTTAQRRYDTEFMRRLESAMDSDTDDLPGGRNVRVLSATDSRASRIEIIDNDKQTLLAAKQIGHPLFVHLLAGIVFVGIGIAWVILLLVDTTQSKQPDRYRCLIDLFFLASGLALATIPGLGNFVPEAATEGQFWRITAFPLAVVTWILVSITLNLKNSSYIWAVVISSCAVPVILPAVLLVVAMRWLRFQPMLLKSEQPLIADEPTHANQNQGRRFRFGIHEVMLLTTGVAIFVGIGSQAMDFVPGGIGYSLLIALAVLLSQNTTIAKTTLMIATVAVFASVLSQPQHSTERWSINHALMLIITFSFAAICGSGIHRKRNPSDQPFNLPTKPSVDRSRARSTEQGTADVKEAAKFIWAHKKTAR
ncbi:hypothetical protein [Planctomycetes bacterium K23_9]|uniref:Uncharacterized protein n=1 Tax=Stieleria marina TaxID=1930275 RepID=A0A517NXG2_9BACT|nr:hypothetical protein K239x_38040 [Planctomycetes bacterium K23_9]